MKISDSDGFLATHSLKFETVRLYLCMLGIYLLQAVILIEEVPDRPFHNFRASKSVD